jgi:4-carboxymuconolactone decarboxylase
MPNTAPPKAGTPKAGTPNSEAYEKGRVMRRRLLGEAYVERIENTVYTDGTMQKFADYATEAVFGLLWSRPGLDVKTRALICVITDTTMGREAELEIHLRMALREGWTEEELVETMLHMAGYVGLPLVREALICARRVFSEARAEAAE